MTLTNKRLRPFPLIILLITLFACQSSQTPLPTRVPIANAPTATPTPIPTNTPLPTLRPTESLSLVTATPRSTATPTITNTPTCVYNIAFVADLTIPDNSVISPQTSFIKSWRVRNNGTCAWPSGTTWVFTDGLNLSTTNSVPVPPVEPGSTTDISVSMRAPLSGGTFTSYWGLRLPDGTILPETFYVRVVVPAPTAPPTNTPKPSSGSSGGSGGSGGGSSPTATAVPTTTTGWQTQYWANTTLSGDAAVTTTTATTDLNLDWGTSAPNNLPIDRFSGRWVRTQSFEAGAYRFFAFADDGVRVYIDGQLLIDEWHEATGQTYQKDTTLTAGSHTIQVDFYENAGEAKIRVWWEQPTLYPEWKADYFDNQLLSGTPVLTRNDTSINFDWGEQSPDSKVPADGFSARWTRTLQFSDDTYRFSATVDDGVRIYVDNTLVVDEWRNGSLRTVFGDINLTAGPHTVVVEYFDAAANAAIQVWWNNQTSAAPTTHWEGAYFDNPDLSGTPVLTRNDADIDFDWGGDAPATGIPADNFSVRWRRAVDFPNGRFRFNAQADDGVRVYVDGQLIIDRWQLSYGNETYTAELNLSGTHTIEVHFYDAAVNARVKVWWDAIP